MLALRRVLKWTLRAIALLVLVLALLVLVFHAWIARQWRVAVIVGTMRDVPVLSTLTGSWTHTPPAPKHVSISGRRAMLFSPASSGKHATVVLLGALSDWSENDDEQRLVQGLVRDDFCVVVGPSARLQARAPAAAMQRFVRASSQLPAVDAQRITLAGAGVDGSLALRSAAQLAAHLQVAQVIAVEPYAQLKEVIEQAIVDPAATQQQVRTDVARALQAVIAREPNPFAATIAAHIDPVAADPYAQLHSFSALPLGPTASALLRLLTARTHRAFDQTFAQLPPSLRDEVASRSPLPAAASLTIPVELIVPSRHAVLSISGAQKLRSSLKHAKIDRLPIDGASGVVLVDGWSTWTSFDALAERILEQAG